MALITPAVIALLAVGIYPLLFVLDVSLRQYQLTKPYLGTDYVGLQNYLSVLNDGLFWGSLGRTALFFLLAVPAEVVLGTLIALFVDGTRCRLCSAVLRVMLVLPIAMTPTVTGLIGRLLFNRDFGLVNYLLSLVGVEPIAWLGEPEPAMITIALMDIWQWTPFVALVMLSGLALVPQDVRESGHLDAGYGWHFFRNIQMPYLLPGLTAVLILRTVDILKLFDMVFVLTRGGPGVSTELVSVYIQRVGFRIFDMGVASAQAILLLVLCIVLSRAYVRFFYRQIEA
ncbi:MAG: sugar ABC transporter permease [Thermoflexales bacterium]|nr:sugar ABC transporter permease [Thermoflexales bacterium]MCX7938961.1 sugar ABC transporter permease [Thermoflexales bacterium]MDW8292711.1 sugar ABC transporter permease [Anaerolineae bacterium]